MGRPALGVPSPSPAQPVGGLGWCMGGERCAAPERGVGSRKREARCAAPERGVGSRKREMCGARERRRESEA